METSFYKYNNYSLVIFVIGFHAFVECVVIFLGVYLIVVTTTGTVCVVGTNELPTVVTVVIVRFSAQEPTISSSSKTRYL